MGIFIKNLKTMKTDITGTELNLKINVAVWLILEEEFGITQGNWKDEYLKGSAMTSAKFVTAVLKANKHEVTLDEVVENVSEFELYDFMEEYQKINLESIIDEESNVTEEKKEEKIVQ